MATAPVLLSFDEYLRTVYKPDADFVEGEIQERNVGKFEHSTFQIALGSFFFVRRKEWFIHPMTEQRVQVARDRVRVADVVVIRADTPREDVTTTTPLICVEILSPDDRLSRAKLVLADYLTMGVEAIWLVDPLRRSAFTFDAAGLHEADPTNLTVPGTPIAVDLSEAFATLD